MGCFISFSTGWNNLSPRFIVREKKEMQVWFIPRSPDFRGDLGWSTSPRTHRKWVLPLSIAWRGARENNDEGVVAHFVRHNPFTYLLV
jgi:hypothetical protein